MIFIHLYIYSFTLGAEITFAVIRVDLNVCYYYLNNCLFLFFTLTLLCSVNRKCHQQKDK